MEPLTYYEKKLEEGVSEWGEDATLVFRGQSNSLWDLNSSAERRLQSQTDSPGLVEYLTEFLIEPARLEGFARRQGRELNDLELLAALQHAGAATCLIDFTVNFHIALWFACQNDDTEGKVFAVNRGDISTFEEITPEKASLRIGELLRSQQLHDDHLSISSKEVLYFWKPPANENRFIVQHSCFVFSASPFRSHLSKAIKITKESKREIRSLLRKFYGLEEQSIFRDFMGFAASQGQGSPFDNKPRNQWFHEGNIRFQRGEYEQAISYYSEEIRCRPDNALAFFGRGHAYMRLAGFEKAIGDYTRAIAIKPEFVDAFWLRGTAQAFCGCQKGALEDFDQVIRIRPDFAEAYNDRGHIRDQLGEYEEAIRDYDEAIRLNPNYARAINDRGTVWGKLEEYDKAIEDFEAAIKINPREAKYFYNLGTAKRITGDLVAARASLVQARNLAQLQGLNELIRQIDQYTDVLASLTGAT